MNKFSMDKFRMDRLSVDCLSIVNWLGNVMKNAAGPSMEPESMGQISMDKTSRRSVLQASTLPWHHLSLRKAQDPMTLKPSQPTFSGLSTPGVLLLDRETLLTWSMSSGWWIKHSVARLWFRCVFNLHTQELEPGDLTPMNHRTQVQPAQLEQAAQPGLPALTPHLLRSLPPPNSPRRKSAITVNSCKRISPKVRAHRTRSMT